MSEITNHPKLPPPIMERCAPMNEAAIRKNVRSMRLFFDGLIAGYPRAALNGKQDAWCKAAHSFIDMMGDG